MATVRPRAPVEGHTRREAALSSSLGVAQVRAQEPGRARDELIQAPVGQPAGAVSLAVPIDDIARGTRRPLTQDLSSLEGGCAIVQLMPGCGQPGEPSAQVM